MHPRPLAVVAALLVGFLYAPLAVAVVFAFNSGSNLSVPLQGLSLRWFRAIFEDPGFSQAFMNSLQVALVTAGVAALIGTAASFVFVRRPSGPVAALEGLSRLPVMLPPLLIGVSLLTTMAAFAIIPSLATVTVGHLVLVIPYVIVVVVARLRTVDLELEQAARDLGARPLEVFRRVTLPLLAPAVAGAAMLAFAFSFDEILITTFTAGLDPTLPLFVVSKMRRTIDPSINAVATVLLLVPWIALALAYLVMRRSLLRAGVEEATGGGESR
jgi:ABC-type spermidine/putrescine transport system permease subunit II